MEEEAGRGGRWESQAASLGVNFVTTPPLEERHGRFAVVGGLSGAGRGSAGGSRALWCVAQLYDLGSGVAPPEL